jgi:hypothetical protein
MNDSGLAIGPNETRRSDRQHLYVAISQVARTFLVERSCSFFGLVVIKEVIVYVP